MPGSTPADTTSFVTSLVAIGAALAAVWQALVSRGQLAAMKLQLEDLQEAKKGKIYKLKRGVNSLRDELENIPAAPSTSLQDISRINMSRLSAIEASSDTFFFKEISKIEGLVERLGELDQASQDAQSDIQKIKSTQVTLIDQAQLNAVAQQIEIVYRLADQCSTLLTQVT